MHELVDEQHFCVALHMSPALEHAGTVGVPHVPSSPQNPTQHW
jgi:hypothetical protein